MISNASYSLKDACIVMCAGSFCTKEKANEIDAFFAAHPLPSSTRNIAQITESMRANAKFLVIPMASDRAKKEFWDKVYAWTPSREESLATPLKFGAK